jgi:tripartite-type tricarboxylate transporter receptor subunit TctC
LGLRRRCSARTKTQPTLLLCTELFKAAAGVDLLRVPYRASPAALTDLIAGRLDVICEPLASSLSNIRAGSLRALAQTGAQRSPAAPDLETVAEAGVGMTYSAWVAFFAPAGVPKDISMRLGNELLAVLQNPAVMEQIRALGFDPRPGDAQSLAAVHRAEMASVAATVKAAGIKAE